MILFLLRVPICIQGIRWHLFGVGTGTELCPSKLLLMFAASLQVCRRPTSLAAVSDGNIELAYVRLALAGLRGLFIFVNNPPGAMSKLIGMPIES